VFTRGENVGCGTSTTGTGSLTFAAVPAGAGLIDPVTAFGTSGSYVFRYTINEYTDSTFATVKQFETGYGTMALNATLTSVTLTRAPLVTGVVATPAYANNAPTAITIGTAANVLVFVGPTAGDLPDALPFFSTSGITNADGLGFVAVQAAIVSTVLTFTTSATNGTLIYQRVWSQFGGLVKSVSVRVIGALTSGGNSTLSAALYDIASTGLPGKQLVSFGTSSAGALGTANTTVTLTASAAIYLPPGFYILALLPFGGTGSSGSATIRAATSCAPSPFGTNMINTTTLGGPIGYATVAAQTALADPATTTSITAAAAATEACAVYRST